MCASKHVCLTVPDPKTVLDSYEVTNNTNFWHRVQPLVSDGGIQRYAQVETFDQE